MQTVGLFERGAVSTNIEYSIRGAPCQNVVGKCLCHYAENLQELFPDDALLRQMGAQSYIGLPLSDSSGRPLGLMAALDSRPMQDGRLAASLLRIASVRVAGELEREIAAAALQESEHRYRQLVEASPDGIFVRCDGKLVFVNRSAMAFFGVARPEEIIGRDFADFVHPHYRDQLSANSGFLRSGAAPEAMRELQLLRVDGSTLDVEVTAMPFNFNGRAAELAIARNVTERKKLESQVLRMQRMESLGTLAGGIAHDLNNVLTPLMFSVQLLKEKITDSEGRDLLDMLEANVRRSANLVQQVLIFGRGIRGEFVQIEPNKLVLEIGQFIHEAFPKSIGFECHSPSGLWRVRGDATQLHQVLLNLCINARDAMPGGGSISIGLSNLMVAENSDAARLGKKPGPYVVLEVVDTGTGIPAAIRDKIFEPFFTTKQHGKGTGLGLSTTVGIVRSHGGYIDCLSTVGQGSTFRVTLPACVGAIEGNVATAGGASLPRGNNELVLLVDDEDSIRSIGQRTLERFGYRVLTASNGAEALELYSARRKEVAVVITDMAMPVMDGPTAILGMLSIDPRARIIGSSGLTSDSPRAKEVKSAVKLFLAKPYTAEAMIKAVHGVLSGEARAPSLAGARSGLRWADSSSS